MSAAGRWAAAGLLAAWAAGGAAAPWVPAAPATAQLDGWHCQSAASLPAPDERRLAVCRRAAPQAGRELELVLIESAGAPRTLVRLADASRAEIHLFVADRACPQQPKSRCIDALALVDQSDESSCYGTQVWAHVRDRDPRSLGFIDEFRPSAEGARCIGGVAEVTADGNALRIRLPDPLARLRRDGSMQRQARGGVSYRIVPTSPALEREAPAR